jgi:alkylation response protein AidB-like acyl-CoA dehydrogenase
MSAPLFTPDIPLLSAQLQSSGSLNDILALPGFSDFSSDFCKAVLEEAGQFAQNILSPLNQIGDRNASQCNQGMVSTPAGFKPAYESFCKGGWNSATASIDAGGQGLPVILNTLISEMWHGSNMAFGLCPMLTQSAIDLIHQHGSETLKAMYLPKLVSGEWSGTMCLTESQAGSDVGAIRTKAIKESDHYRILGTKIYITYGEHDLASNIIHLVLARLENAPSGSKGLSLFLVPKFLPDASRNEVSCLSIEHKLGLHASPTCTMQFGEQNGAIGYLVGEENKGIQAMFSMMNAARFAVGLEGVGVAGYARQLARAYASERIQMEPVATPRKTIDGHPDVERMLRTLDAHSMGLRALALYTAHHMDMASRHSDSQIREHANTRTGLLIPIFKSHATSVAFEMTSHTMQVFGGMGYIEEAGIAQLMRDIRVAMIYEGTNGIQAQDLVLRKVPQKQYQPIRTLNAEIWDFVQQWRALPSHNKTIVYALESLFETLDQATIWIEQTHSDSATDPLASRALLAASDRYLKLLGLWTEAYLLAKTVYDLDHIPSLSKTPVDTREQVRLSAEFFCLHLLPETRGLLYQITHTRFWCR